MTILFTSLNSGSNGNCYYVGNEYDAILVDAGISCREIETRLKQLGLGLEKLRGIIISHEHADHIKGLPVFQKKYQVPVYITGPTLRQSGLKINPQFVRNFSASHPIAIGSLILKAFPKNHDAIDPYSFTISSGGINVGVFTDIGTCCEHLISHFKNCHAAFLEANYDDAMLDKGSYPYYLKSRIRGGKGHLSNKQALEIFTTHRPAFMSHLILSHLSKNNNCPQLVQELFDQHANDIKIIVASRYEATAVYSLESCTHPFPQGAAAQMSLPFK